MRLWRKHRCPSSVVLEIRLNGQTVLGPMDAEHLGLIAKFGGEQPFDLMDYGLADDVRRVEMLATYKPGG